MKTSQKNLKQMAANRNVVRAMVLTVTAGLAFASCSDQPNTYCIVTPGLFAVRLIPTGTAPACAAMTTAGFNADPEVGLAPYFPKNDKGQPDYDRGRVGIKTTEIGNYWNNAGGMMPANGTPYSLGDFRTAQADDSGLCYVDSFSETNVMLPAVPATMDAPAQDAVNMKLEWSQMKVVDLPAAIGTQFSVNVKDTRVTSAGTCVSEYKALGLAPAIPCAVTDADGNRVMNPMKPGKLLVNPNLCDPNPGPLCDPNVLPPEHCDPKAMRFTGSGIDAVAAYTCDEDIGFCVVAKDDVPSFK